MQHEDGKAATASLASGGPIIIVLMGVSGCGKSTTGNELSAALGWPFRDADSFHPSANIAKMSRGLPLSDEDRWPWLSAIGHWMDAQIAQGRSGIVSCSALKRAYRQVLLAGRPAVRLVHLEGEQDLIAERLRRRKEHFMPTSLLQSQFAALEVPDADERPLTVSVRQCPVDVVAEICTRLGLPSRPARQSSGSA